MGPYFIWKCGLRDGNCLPLKDRIQNKVPPIFSAKTKDEFEKLYKDRSFVLRFSSIMSSHTSMIIDKLPAL